MPIYTITENPPFPNEGESTTTSMDPDNEIGIIDQSISTGRLTDVPRYQIVQATPGKVQTTTVNTTVINNTTIIQAGESIEVSAEYFNTAPLTNITTRTLISNNGAGAETYDDNTTPIFNTASFSIVPTVLKEVLDIQLRFRITTDTLGGAFEVEANNGSVIDIIEEEINIQQQDYTINFKLVVDQDSIDNGIQFFITPELGMAISITNYSLVIIKG